jgi:hypothetical protein
LREADVGPQSADTIKFCFRKHFDAASSGKVFALEMQKEVTGNKAQPSALTLAGIVTGVRLSHSSQGGEDGFVGR